MYFEDGVPINFCLNSEKRKFKSPFLEVLDIEKFKKETLEYEDYINVQNLYGNTILHVALTNPKCDVREIEMLLKNGAKLDIKNKVGDTPLSFAVYYSVNVEVVKLLLDKGADVNATNNFLDTPLHRALDKHKIDIEVVKLLLDYKADLNKLNSRNDAPLHHCLDHSPDVNVVRLLLDRGANYRLINKNRNTLLHMALDKEYNLEVIKLLLDTGIPINSKNKDNDTPLQFALRNFICRPDIIKLLLEHDADCNTPSFYYFPIQTALRNVASTREVFQMLLYYGAMVDVTDSDENSVLHTACISPAHCNVETIKLLLGKGAYVNAVNSARETPLIFAVKCLNCNLDVIELLLKCGASDQISDIEGNSPLHFAISRTNCTIDIVKLLLRYGADVNQKNDCGKTPLCVELSNRKPRMDVIKFLLDNGANVNSIDMHANTPLHHALSNPICTIELASLLLMKKASLNVINNFLETPMHCAMRTAKVTLIKFLLEKRGRINSRDKTGKYPIERVIENYNSPQDVASKDFLKLLIKYSLLDQSGIDVEDFLVKSFDFCDLLKFVNECRMEVGQMHYEYITHGLKLWRLIGNRKFPVKEKWLEMEWDIKNLLEILANNKYPIYRDVISSTIKRDAMIPKFKDNVIYTVNNDTNSMSFLNFHSVCCLSEQLSNESLLNLLLAFHAGGKYLRKRRSSVPLDGDVKRRKLQAKKKRKSVYVPT